MIGLLDTTAFSAAMRGDPDLMEFLRARRPGEVTTAPPVVAEIEYGIRRMDVSSRKRTLLEAQRDRFLAVIRILPWTPESSSAFGSIKAGLERAGELIDDFDIAIAAIALSHGVEVITANLVHFGRVSGLTCRHWRQ